MSKSPLVVTLLALTAMFAIASCGPKNSDFASLDPEHNQKIGRSSLEVPPDLVDTTSETLLASQAEQEQEEAQTVLPEIKNLDIQRNDDEGWLEVNADADLVWQKIIAHWGNLGVGLVMADPKTGTMETDWVVPGRRSDQGSSGFFGSLLSTVTDKYFDEATSLDKYTVQLERTGENSTRINVAQRGLKKVQTSRSSVATNAEYEWVETEEEHQKVIRAMNSLAYGLDTEGST